MAPRGWKACPFCGREYGSSSFAIHVERCVVRPDEETLRRQLAAAGRAPSRPGVPQHFRVSAAELAELAEQGGAPLGHAPCACCGRRFTPDRLPVHERICARIRARARRRGGFDSAQQRLAPSDGFGQPSPARSRPFTSKERLGPPPPPRSRPFTSKERLGPPPPPRSRPREPPGGVGAPPETGRRAGLGGARGARPAAARAPPPPSAGGWHSNWRHKHTELQQAVRSARGAGAAYSAGGSGFLAGAPRQPQPQPQRPGQLRLSASRPFTPAPPSPLPARARTPSAAAVRAAGSRGLPGWGGACAAPPAPRVRTAGGGAAGVGHAGLRGYQGEPLPRPASGGAGRFARAPPRRLTSPAGLRAAAQPRVGPVGSRWTPAAQPSGRSHGGAADGVGGGGWGAHPDGGRGAAAAYRPSLPQHRPAVASPGRIPPRRAAAASPFAWEGSGAQSDRYY